MKAFIKYWSYFLYYYFGIRLRMIRYNKTASEKLANKAMLFALMTHHGVRQKYDKYPYYFHLHMVAMFALKFCHLVDNDIKVLLGALFHDLIEDCRLTYNDVKGKWGKDVADIVFACTELRGRNRDERHGPEYYKLLQEHRLGRYVKICDVIANMTRGVQTGSGMLKKYRTGYKHFKELLYTEEFKPMFDYIEANLLTDKK